MGLKVINKIFGWNKSMDGGNSNSRRLEQVLENRNFHWGHVKFERLVNMTST